MFLKFIIFICAFLCTVFGRVSAQTKNEKDSLRHTSAPPITVTADAETLNILLHPTDIHTVSSKELSLQTGATRLSDGLQTLHPSLDIRNYGSLGGISLASFRGLPVEYTSLYWEGIKITNSQLGLTDFGLINLKSVHSVGIISAANAQLIAGDIGSAGILLSTNPSEETSGLNLGTSTLSYNNISSFDEQQLSVGGVGKLGDEVSITGGASTAYSNGAFPFIQQIDEHTTTIIKRSNNDAHLFNADLAANCRIDESAHIKALSFFTRAERGSPEQDVINYAGASNFLARFYDENFLSSISLSHQPLANFNYSVSLAYQSQYETYIDPSLNISDHYLNRIYSFVLKSKTNLAEWADLYSGVDYTKNILFSNENSIGLHDTAITREHYAAYLAQKIKLSDYFDATISLRTELLSYNDKPQVLPGISIHYSEPTTHLQLQGAYGRLYHAPTLNELYWKQGGNANLNPENGDNIEFSVQLPFSIEKIFLFEIQTTVFQTQLSNQIIWQPGLNGIWSPSNLQSARSQGFEFVGQVQCPIGELYNLTLRENLSLEKTRNLTDSSSYYGKELPYSTPMRSSLFLQFTNIKIGSLSFTALYRGHRYTDFYNNESTRLQPMIKYDLIFSSIPFIFSNALNASVMLSILNLTNAQYQEIPNFPLPGRSIRASLDFHFL